MDINSLSYIAGFFDGEGGICIGRRGKPGKRYLQLHVSITNTHREVLLLISRILGEKVVFRNKDHGRKTRERLRQLAMSSKPCYELVYTGKNAGNVLSKLLPHLIVKRGEAEIALRFQDTFMDRWSRRKTPEHLLLEREGFREELKSTRTNH